MAADMNSDFHRNSRFAAYGVERIWGRLSQAAFLVSPFCVVYKQAAMCLRLNFPRHLRVLFIL